MKVVNFLDNLFLKMIHWKLWISAGIILETKLLKILQMGKIRYQKYLMRNSWVINFQIEKKLNCFFEWLFLYLCSSRHNIDRWKIDSDHYTQSITIVPDRTMISRIKPKSGETNYIWPILAELKFLKLNQTIFIRT